MYSFVVVFLLACIVSSDAIANEGVRIRRRPYVEDHDANPLRRQGYGYTTSIVHQTPGNSAQHASSEINVNMGGDQRVANYNQPKFAATNNNNNYLKYDMQKSPGLLFTPNSKYMPMDLPMQERPAKLLEQPNEGQNTFNVGYSIGFGNAPDPKPNPVTIALPTIPRPNFRAADIVTGTPTVKVPKPITMQLSAQDPKDYVMTAVQSYQNINPQYTPQQQTLENQQKQSLQENTFNFNQPQFTKNLEQFDYKLLANQNGAGNAYKSGAMDLASYGWKSLSPSVEIASSNAHRARSNSHNNIAPASVTVTAAPHFHSAGHNLLTASNTNHHQAFDHAQAIGHSQGFDYSNAVNMEQGLAGAQSALRQTLHSKPSNEPIQIDNSLLENFYKNYKPLPVNWFNPHDAMEQKSEASSKQIQSTHHQQQQQLPVQIDTRLLQQNPILTTTPMQPSPNMLPIHIDTSMLQKALANSQNGQISINITPNSPHPTFTFTQNPQAAPAQPAGPAPVTQISFGNNQPSRPSQYDAQLSQPQVQAHAQQQQRQLAYDTQMFTQNQYQQHTSNQRLSSTGGGAPPTSSASVSAPIFDQQQQGSTSQVNNVQSEQIIKGKHKKPGVVRHPRLLNVDQQPQQALPVGVVRNFNPMYNLNTDLRPPPVGNTYMLKSPAAN